MDVMSERICRKETQETKDGKLGVRWLDTAVVPARLDSPRGLTVEQRRVKPRKRQGCVKPQHSTRFRWTW